MSYAMRRVIIFTHNFAAIRDFYRDMFGLGVVEEDDGWADLSAGGCNIAIHAAGKGVTVGPDYEGPHKIVFHADDVVAARADLVSRGARMDEVKVFGDLHLCDGSDPDENRFQISNRR
ncbi:MAG: VOC family protein [Proteobacteria bacterium]|nr:VOC family protein [Pseudomonadota bacterium]